MTRSIYLVDDDDAVRASLHSLLSLQDGLTVRSFRNGDNFLAEAPYLDPGVLLLDFHMQGSNGIDVLNRLNEIGARHFSAIIVTGEGNVALAVQAMRAGALDFLEKPYQAEALLASVALGFERLLEDHAATTHARESQERIAALSPRERDVLAGLIEGRANKAIAHRLEISPRTVEIYRANLMTKLGVRSLPEVLRIAFAAGVIPTA